MSYIFENYAYIAKRMKELKTEETGENANTDTHDYIDETDSEHLSCDHEFYYCC
jgi:hypothetical protein